MATSEMPRAKQCRPQLTLPEISALQQNIKDPEEIQRLLDYGTSLAEAAKKGMSSSVVCAVCEKEGGKSMKPTKKCKCRFFTVCEECDVANKLEDMDVMKCESCEDLACSTRKGNCERYSCDIRSKGICKDCMTKTRCERATLRLDCSEGYACEDCDICMGCWN